MDALTAINHYVTPFLVILAIAIALRRYLGRVAMTDDEAIARGWTYETQDCCLCGQSQRVLVPPPHPKLVTPPRPQAEHDSAQRTNDAIREQTERNKNERV